MKNLYKMENTIQDYAWGSLYAFTEHLGIPNSNGKPMAELWMGAHPKSPSKIELENTLQPLDAAIAALPEEFLGAETAKKYGNKLPYLFKVLGIGKGLSIQVHPNKKQAEEGFARENADGIPVDAFNRNYRDDNHKPEIICAFTDFWALRGFRPLEEIKTHFREISSPVSDSLAEKDSHKEFFKTLMTLENGEKEALIKRALEVAKTQADDPKYHWIAELNSQFPLDIGVLAPLYLNVVKLKPGQAMFLAAGELHAYLSGTGIELMANSDNVLRGGCTPKYVDVPELMNILAFEGMRPEILEPVEKVGRTIYGVDTDEFLLSVMKLEGEEQQYQVHSLEIVLSLSDNVTIQSGNESIEMKKGTAVLVPTSAGTYSLHGAGVLYSASVPV